MLLERVVKQRVPGQGADLFEGTERAEVAHGEPSGIMDLTELCLHSAVIRSSGSTHVEELGDGGDGEIFTFDISVKGDRHRSGIPISRMDDRLS